MSDCPRCYVYKNLDGQYKINYCALHALAPWMAQWLSEIIELGQDNEYVQGLQDTTIHQLKVIGALDEDNKITEWVKEIKW